MNNAAMSSHGQVFEWTYIFSFLGTYTGVEWLSYMVTIFKFLRNIQAVFQSDGTILCSHQQCVRVPASPHPCQHLSLPAFFLLDPSSRCVVVSHCGSDFQFPGDCWCRAPSLVLLTTCVSLLPFCQAQQILSVMHFSQDLLRDLRVPVWEHWVQLQQPLNGKHSLGSTFRDDSGADFEVTRVPLNRRDREACCLLETARRGWVRRESYRNEWG